MTTAVIIVVLVLGLVLIFTEVAVIPGFGVAGALGLLALAAGAIAAWTQLGPVWGGVAGGASVLAAGAMLYWLPKSRVGRQMVLEHSQAEAVSQADRSELVGRRGITVTPLRPIGRVRFGTEEVDVMTEGEYVDTNQEVEVTSVQGPRVVVRVPDPT